MAIHEHYLQLFRGLSLETARAAEACNLVGPTGKFDISRADNLRRILLAVSSELAVLVLELEGVRKSGNK